MYFKLNIYFSPKHRKVHTRPDLKSDDLAGEIPHCLTNRMLLSQIATQYDPLGLVCPVTLRAKLMMRHLIAPEITLDCKNKKYDRDDSVSPQIRSEWMSYFKMLFE